jgi:hypothetical protein
MSMSLRRIITPLTKWVEGKAASKSLNSKGEHQHVAERDDHLFSTIVYVHAACSLGLSATSQQYFSLRTNQPPATSRNQPAVLFSQNKPAPAISQPNRL